MSMIEESVEVNVPVADVYSRWLQFQHFPEFMHGIQEVQRINQDQLHWRARIAGVTREWDAEITERIPNEQIAWKATDGHPNDGVVSFASIDAGRTRVTLQMEHEPEGVIEKVGDKLGVVEHQAKSDLQRFKEMMESANDPKDPVRRADLRGLEGITLTSPMTSASSTPTPESRD